MSTVNLRSSRAQRDFVSELVRSWASGVRRAADLLLTWQQRARDRRQLQSLSDHMLRDIGLTRADVFAEASKPFWRP
jgi:uncharacterized protein YjiS (DUF1127 family)